ACPRRRPTLSTSPAGLSTQRRLAVHESERLIELSHWRQARVDGRIRATPHRCGMDDSRLGGLVRAMRIRRGWRQLDLAATAGVSTATVSRFERGHVVDMPLRTVRAIAGALEIRIELLPRSRGGDVDRIINARHAALSEAVIEWLGRFPDWVVRPEVSYSWFGERGVVDIVAWHARTRALLEVELKTSIV